MAKQCGVNLFVGTRYGCTGYILDGLPYIRRRSSLDGKQWRRSPAFVRARAASVVFGGASTLASQLWAGIPSKMKKCMDAGAYNRLVVAVQQTHLTSGATYVHRPAQGKTPAYPELVVDRFEGKHLGRALNGMDLSEGRLMASGLQLEARGSHGKQQEAVVDLGGFFHLERVAGVSLHGLGNLGLDFGKGAAVRARLHVARVEALPHTWAAVPKRYFRERGTVPEVAFSTSEWKALGSVSGSEECISLALPGRIVAAGDEERWFLNVVALEVGIQQPNGRWRRLDAACKAFVVCNAQGGESVAAEGEEVGDARLAGAPTKPGRRAVVELAEAGIAAWGFDAGRVRGPT